ncbi:MAG: EFR1 family ferrodoxin [Coriobacteriales bacterium]|nr:EFR1 family ferrodoxin [Coriobacteriales bacterium]
MRTFYFTGTGNCLQVARAVGTGGELVSIPVFLRENSAKGFREIEVSDSKIGIVFPTYWFTTPPLIAEFFARTRLKSPYVFVISTRGNLSLAVKAQMLYFARKGGFCLSYFATLTMPDNYLPLFDMARQRQRFTEAKLAADVALVASEVEASTQNVGKTAGLAPLRGVMWRVATRQLSGFERHLTVDGRCNECGTCELVCPMRNIVRHEGRPYFGSSCAACLSCAHTCPSRAIHVKGEKNSERYRNATVSVADLVRVNGPQ